MYNVYIQVLAICIKQLHKAREINSFREKKNKQAISIVINYYLIVSPKNIFNVNIMCYVFIIFQSQNLKFIFNAGNLHCNFDFPYL